MTSDELQLEELTPGSVSSQPFFKYQMCQPRHAMCFRQLSHNLNLEVLSMTEVN